MTTTLAALCLPYLWPSKLCAAFPHLDPAPPPSRRPGWCVRDRELQGAYGAGPEETQILAEIVAEMRPRRALEIGAYVGWTTAHLAAALPDGATLDVVDPFIEGEHGRLHEATDGRVRSRFEANLRRAGVRKRVRLHVARSPEALAPAAARARAPWSFVFIDGHHVNGQPLADLRGALPFVAERAAVAFHDTHVPDVAAAVTHLERGGWSVAHYETTNGLCVARRGTV
jgi:predicted O-methyltransferase YrrM